MRAVQITPSAASRSSKSLTSPEPTPGQGQQLYDVSTAGVNYADTHHAVW
jgi:NADPH:quinone reductase-like Zn-dependent oxidoreductase